MTKQMTQYQRSKLPTTDDVRAEGPDHLNEWGHPCSNLYRFRGYVNGAARWEPLYVTDRFN